MPRTPDQVSDELLALLLCPGLGPAGIALMVRECGSFEGARRASAAQWRRVLGSLGGRAVVDRGGERGAAIVEALAGTDPAQERRRMEDAGLRMVVLGDPDYPAQLAMIDVPPMALWMRGRMEALGPVPVAVVGARRATAYGMTQAGRFAAHLCEEGMTIISGGARGIDAQAHRATLRLGGPTVAVLGCGLGACPYPPEHAALYEEIVRAGGLLLSEFPSHWPVLPANFPRRNRIIAGLAGAVLVVEAGVTSGALITARVAHEELNRPVFALPGPVDSPASAGCNLAIQDNLAAMALHPQDVADALQTTGVLLMAGARGAAPAPPEPLPDLPEQLRDALPAVRHLLQHEPHADCARVVDVTGLPVHHAQAALTLLALDAAAAAAPARRRSPSR